MNPLARELNEIIKKENPYVFEMLSELGKELFFPKGILTQTAEAKEKANRHDATIGIAKEGSEAMYLECFMQSIKNLGVDDIFPYAPTTGKSELRRAWFQEMMKKNPGLQGKAVSLPIVTSGLTHGLGLVGDLFVNPGDIVILPDKNWGNYKMMFSTCRKALVKQYAFFDGNGGFNLEAFKAEVEKDASKKGKVITILNFPNNPTGYSLIEKESLAVRDILVDVANGGANVIAIVDDAYFGLFYDDDVMKESVFVHLADSHERILAIKLDGATKEDYVWGFRVGFISYSVGGTGNRDILFNALEKKTGGAIRAQISNCPHISQSIVLKAMSLPGYSEQKREKYEIMKARAQQVKKVLSDEKYNSAWEPYPFNSGYFMCLHLKAVDAEELRKHLLDKYGVGVIALDESDIRIAFSCLEVEDIEDLFDTMLQAVKDLES